ncbi:hypothetical protein [Deinococcus aluminii]|uniref:hypothetical protein n=1 Tax=Deinococcus aluminii TaxID=1656885 RepID=UPI0031E636DD
MRTLPAWPSQGGGYDTGENVNARHHQQLAKAFLNLDHDPTPIPLSSAETPLLP